MGEEAWKEFESYARERFDKSEAKRIVPIVGSGFNVMATGKKDSWNTLINQISDELNIPKKDRLPEYSMTGTWEWLVTNWSTEHTEPPFEAEKVLRKKVASHLKDFEENEKQCEFYGTFLQLGFRDIISLNFDRTLALQFNSGKRPIKGTNRNPFDPEENLPRHLKRIFRHAKVKNSHATRVWYPHGDTQNAATIMLGIRDYGLYIESLDSAFGHFKKVEAKFNKKHKITKWTVESYKEWSNFIGNLDNDQINWLWRALCAPIVFIGCGLSQDEWPLWWFLHQRARNFGGHTGQDPVFVFWNVKQRKNEPRQAAVTNWLEKSPTGIRLLPCTDWQRGWKRLLDILRQ